MARASVSVVAAFLVAGCAGPKDERASPSPPARPSILLVTLDTTRADAIGPEAAGVETPAFDALAARGRRFRRAYAAAPETLPSHASMMTGLMPAGHGVRQNAQPLPAGVPLAAERLRSGGYSTAAFVSAFVLARRFGLARGFDVYDDALAAGQVERPSAETADRVLAFLDASPRRPLFLWVHFFDPHAPYTPPEPFASRHRGRPYHGEVAAMDAQLGRVATAFERWAGLAAAIVIAGDHGEGLGDHNERQHGNLLYDSTMRVPLLLVGPGVAAGVEDEPASLRRVFGTLTDWAGLSSADGLVPPRREIVLGEAMKPFLAYGWQPQVMAAEGRHKAILSGRLEAYDIAADPAEAHDVAATASLSRALRDALRSYPAPAPGAARAGGTLGEAERQQLASLGYVSGGAAPVARKDAPRPADMAALFDDLERASALFVAREYAAAIPLLRRIRARDPGNLDAALRLGAAHSALGQDARAEAAFDAAAEMAPDSEDVRTYRALHYARGGEWARAVPLLERVVADSPDRVPVLEALAVVRERQGRVAEAIDLRRRVYALRAPTAEERTALAMLLMQGGRTAEAIDALEAARREQGDRFRHHLELGVLYLAARRLAEARDALDRVPPGGHDHAMALFKRAQVSVLLGEPDRAARIERARAHADATTGPLIARERLFRR
jgi:arylsulfatase A-like enzyme/Flp pilus assembly protein TadD